MTEPGTRVRVDARAAPARGYDVRIRAGSLAGMAADAAAAAPASAYVIIAPHTIAETHAHTALRSFRDAGSAAHLLLFDDAEVHKTRETWASLTDRIVALRLGRDTCIVALGGGVTGDMAGFVAATYMRGVPLVQVPTTLLAMIDASVGGKTGVDTREGKNLVGAFHAPCLVLIDPLTLHTLPDAEVRSGLAEAVKHGAILDAAYFEWLARNADALRTLDAAALEHVIARSVELKAGVVARDPFEQGLRTILNFGHTIGHALEHHSRYALRHGYAVAAGMIVEARIGEAAGITRPGTAEQLGELCALLELPTHSPARHEDLLAAMQVDKKSRHAEPRFVLLERIGRCVPDRHGLWSHAVAPDLIRTALAGPSTPVADV